LIIKKNNISHPSRYQTAGGYQIRLRIQGQRQGKTDVKRKPKKLKRRQLRMRKRLRRTIER
jgi:hypothetical protein